MEKTKNYKLFKFIDSNRHIDENHVKQLIELIQENNLLFAEPIKVNSNFEVIDGQHRLMAAKALGVDIYYIKDDKLQKHDMIMFNKAQKRWGQAEYLHYYVSEQYPEYIKLKRFIEENGISMNIAISLCDMWRSTKAQKRFRDGEFIFNDTYDLNLIEKAKSIIDLIKVRKGFSNYLKSSLFFKSLCIMLSTSSVDYASFREKLEMQMPKIGAQTNIKNYIEMFLDIYNFRLKKPISLDEIEI